MVTASMWARSVARAQQEAEKMYPNQPERARRMIHQILGMYDGPYDLEPLTIIQRIEVTFGTVNHIVDIGNLTDLSFWGQFKRGFRFFFTGT